MTDKMVEAYLKALESEERAAATIEKYRRALPLSATMKLLPARRNRKVWTTNMPTSLEAVLLLLQLHVSW